MRKTLLSALSLTLLLCWPLNAQEPAVPEQVEQLLNLPERLKLASEDHYLQQLTLAGRSLESQGWYIESLDGSAVLADHQSDTPFNPASVIKVATSFAALDRFGPDYQFETTFMAAGEIDKKTKTLKGDLVLSSSGDPVLSAPKVTQLLSQVVKAGITKVTGSLIVTGPFTYAGYLTTAQSVKSLEKALKKRGIRVAKPTKRVASRGGTVLATHKSETLREIVFTQNAYSTNQTAERLGEAVGGPKGVENFLVNGIGIPSTEVHVGTTSGLYYNRITAKGTVQLLRHLVLWLNLRNLLPQDILPVAGMDNGTLHSRFTSIDYRGSVIGKTGTLPRTDGGVSALAGFAYTRDRGVLVFAIFNTKGNVNTARTLQDSLLMEVIGECGGPEISGSSRRSGN